MIPFAAFLCAACRLNADYGGTAFHCSDGVCPAGYTCVAELCVTGTADAGDADPDALAPPDTGVAPPDAPIQPQPDAAPPAPCGRPDVFTDDFDDGIVWTWGWGWEDPGADLAEAGGHGIVTLAGTGNAYSAWSTSRWFNLAEGRMFVEIPVMANVSTHAQVVLQAVDGDSGDQLTIVQGYGTLAFQIEIGGVETTVDSVAYDPTLHRFWQLRSQGGMTYWETSSDGVGWSVQAMAPDPPFVSHVRAELMVGTYQPETNPGEVHFDDYNGGGPPAGRWCPAASPTDDFDDGIEGVLWSRSYGSTCVRDENGGQATFTPSMGSSNYCGYWSGTAFDLTGSSMIVELVQGPATGATGAQAYFRAEHDQQNSLEFMLNASGTLSARTWIDDVLATVDSTPYVPANHRWLRFREESGEAVWETSGNGTAWTELARTTVPFPLTRVDAILGAGTTAATPIAPGTIRFDNFNLPP